MGCRSWAVRVAFGGSILPRQSKKRGVAPRWARGVLCALALSNDDRAARSRNNHLRRVSFLSFSVSARIANLIFLVYISGAVTGGSLFALLRRLAILRFGIGNNGSRSQSEAQCRGPPSGDRGEGTRPAAALRPQRRSPATSPAYSGRVRAVTEHRMDGPVGETEYQSRIAGRRITRFGDLRCESEGDGFAPLAVGAPLIVGRIHALWSAVRDPVLRNVDEVAEIAAIVGWALAAGVGRGLGRRAANARSPSTAPRRCSRSRACRARMSPAA
jgi:hypothetical protein